MKKRKTTLLVLVMVLLLASLNACSLKGAGSTQKIYVAWSDNMETYSIISLLRTIEAAGAEAVVLDQALSADLDYDADGNLINAEDEHGILTSESAKKVKVNTWQNSNVPEIMEGVDCVVFPGGKDISPTLFYDEQEWHGIEGDTNYSGERDVSDYILLSYCLEKDIPVLAICRGMQMMSVVSGAEIIQDIPQWYKDQGIEFHPIHRDPQKKVFTSHPVQVLSHDSLLYKITGTDTIDKVPSWHHQMVGSVDNTRLEVTAQTETDGKEIIEAVERPDKKFCIGVQYHPEVAARKNLDHEEDAGLFMDYDAAMVLFNALLEEGKR